MTQEQNSVLEYRVADLPTSRPTRFKLEPDAAEMAAIASELGLIGLKKLRFQGQIRTQGKRDWLLEADLGATVVQECVVTLAPVTTRIDQKTARRYSADYVQGDEEETEMPEDDSTDPLGSHISPHAVMIEALSLALPPYPKAEGAELENTVFSEPGVAPLTDEAIRPFAGLASLRDKLAANDGEKGE